MKKMKYGNLTLGQIKALLNLLGGEDEALAVLRGEKILRIEAPEIKEINLFDRNGRRIPPKGLHNSVCDPNKSFYLVRPKLDYTERLERFQEAFYPLHPGPISVDDFERKTKRMISEIKSNKLLASLIRGVYLPIILPQIEDKGFDYGRVLEKIFLPAVKQAYEKQFPSREFYNYRKDKLEGQVNIVPGTRHEKLIERMKQGIVYAIYFPNPLQGWSVLASREQMSTLPESLILSGPLDAATARAEYPDVLARDWHTPGYDLSAISWQSPDDSLYFEVYDGEMCFDGRTFLDCVYGNFSSGLLFLGSVV